MSATNKINYFDTGDYGRSIGFTDGKYRYTIQSAPKNGTVVDVNINESVYTLHGKISKDGKYIDWQNTARLYYFVTVTFMTPNKTEYSWAYEMDTLLDIPGEINMDIDEINAWPAFFIESKLFGNVKAGIYLNRKTGGEEAMMAVLPAKPNTRRDIRLNIRDYFNLSSNFRLRSGPYNFK